MGGPLDQRHGGPYYYAPPDHQTGVAAVGPQGKPAPSSASSGALRVIPATCGFHAPTPPRGGLRLSFLPGPFAGRGKAQERRRHPPQGGTRRRRPSPLPATPFWDGGHGGRLPPCAHAAEGWSGQGRRRRARAAPWVGGLGACAAGAGARGRSTPPPQPPGLASTARHQGRPEGTHQPHNEGPGPKAWEMQYGTDGTATCQCPRPKRLRVPPSRRVPPLHDDTCRATGHARGPCAWATSRAYKVLGGGSEAPGGCGEHTHTWRRRPRRP